MEYDLDDEQADDEDEDAQDDAGHDHDAREPAVGHPAKRSTAWEVCMTNRDDAGQWRTIGDPVEGTSFETMALAHDYAERRNRREFGQRFDWTLAPAKAWIAVRAGAGGALRLHQPEPEPVTAERSQPAAPLRSAGC